MKINIIIKANAYVSSHSEVFINLSIIEVGMSLYNLYDQHDFEYDITNIHAGYISVNKCINGSFIEKINIPYTSLQNNFHWYFLNKGDFIFLTAMETVLEEK